MSAIYRLWDLGQINHSAPASCKLGIIKPGISSPQGHREHLAITFSQILFYCYCSKTNLFSKHTLYIHSVSGAVLDAGVKWQTRLNSAFIGLTFQVTFSRWFDVRVFQQRKVCIYIKSMYLY